MRKQEVSKAELTGGEQRSITAIIVGEPEAGRTSLALAFDQAANLPKLGSRRGEQLKIKASDPRSSTKYDMNNDERIALREKSFDVALVCVDLSKPIDSENIASHINDLERYSRNQDIKIVIVGTKKDAIRDDAQIHDDKLRAVANQYGFNYASCSKDDLKSVQNVADVVRKTVAPPKAEQHLDEKPAPKQHEKLFSRFHRQYQTTLNLTVTGLEGEKNAHLQIIPTTDDKFPVHQLVTHEKDFFRPGQDFRVLNESMQTASGSSIKANTSEKKPGVVNVEVTVINKTAAINEAATVIEGITRSNPEISVVINKSDNSKLAQQFTDALASKGLNLKSAETTEYKSARGGPK